MARLAGDAIADYLGTGPNMSNIAQAQHMREGKENISGMRNEALVGGTSIGEDAATMAHGAIMEARGDYMDAQQQASNMSSAGGMLGNAIGGLGSLFGGGGTSGGGGGGTFSSPVSTSGINFDSIWG